MLVLSRQRDEAIVIDNGRIEIRVVDIRGDKVRLGTTAARDVPVHREEVYQEILREQARAEAANAAAIQRAREEERRKGT